jgi:hypothetical protein
MKSSQASKQALEEKFLLHQHRAGLLAAENLSGTS